MPQRTYDLSDGHLLTFRTRNQHHCNGNSIILSEY